MADINNADGGFSLSLLFLLLMSICPLGSFQFQQPQMMKISEVDLNALRSIKNTLTDLPLRRIGMEIVPAPFFSTWDFTASDPCSSFSGVTCYLGRVTILSLGTGLSDSPGLAGSLSPSISNLTQLTQLILFPGIVTGPIPPQLGRLRYLRIISLTNNRLTGPIPTTLSSLVTLHTLDLSHNQLTGFIPPSLTRLPILKILILASNQLTGQVPNLVTSPLLHLDLKTNRLNGTLPTQLPLSLRYMSLSGNMLVGQLLGKGNGLESLSDLVYLDLSMNNFVGPIPPSLFRTPSLSSLFLQRNSLSGELPRVDPTSTSISYGGGSIVDLSHNNLTGEIPENLAAVESLFLNNNRLTGAVPAEYVKSVSKGSTKTLYLQHNYISQFTIQPGTVLPDTASLCLSYNCMEPPVGLQTCPGSAGEAISRPAWQCYPVKHGSSSAGANP